MDTRGTKYLSRLMLVYLILMGTDVPTLQGMMRCEKEGSGKTHWSWQFGFNGQTNLLFSSDNSTWTELHPGATWLKTALENDEHMTTLLQKVSAGDCQKWLSGFLSSRKEMLGTTGNYDEV